MDNNTTWSESPIHKRIKDAGLGNADNKTTDSLAVDSASPGYTSRFRNKEPVKIPLGDGTYQECTFIGTDFNGVSTVKTKGGRYRIVWDCNLYKV